MRFYVAFCNKGKKNMFKTYTLVMLTYATATNMYKPRVQELSCAIYKINDD